MKGHLLTIVSHELRTPLTSLLMTVELIMKKDPVIGNSDSFKRLRESAKGLELHYIPDALDPIVSDPKLLKIILYNIICNAIKFTHQGSITVKASTTNEEFYLEVSDTGPGIAQEHVQRIFEPFEQLELLRNKGLPGVGLGLAFVKGVVEALKGTCSVKSKPGEGSTFIVSIPVKKDRKKMAS